MIDAPFVRSAYNYDMNQAGDESGLKCEDPSLTKQSFLEESDINTIVRKFGVTGDMPSNVRMPTYGDFTTVHDFKSAMDSIALANESFDQMPAEVRARFHNDPQEFLQFCSDENNRQEAERLGLVSAEALKKAADLAAQTSSTVHVTGLGDTTSPNGGMGAEAPI